jgi:Fe2+ or Zn2+ uptake regulation protein
MIEDIYLYDIQLRRLYGEMKKLGEEIGANANKSEINLSGLCKKCRDKNEKNEVLFKL